VLKRCATRHPFCVAAGDGRACSPAGAANLAF